MLHLPQISGTISLLAVKEIEYTLSSLTLIHPIERMYLFSCLMLAPQALFS